MSLNSKIKIDETFYNENGNLKRLPSDFYYKKFIFDDYKFRKENGQFIIYAKIDYGTDLQTFSTEIESKTPELLISMLKLRDSLPKEIFESPTKILLCDEFLSDGTAEQIINWCKLIGFPFAGDTILKNSTSKIKSKKILNTIKPDKYISFKLSDFIFQLNEIYSAFYMYRIINGYADKIDFPIYTKNSFTNTFGKNSFVNLKELRKNECTELFEYKYQNIKYENKISLIGEPHFIINAKNLFDAAFYQLALLLYNKEKEIRICALCHEYFEPKDPRQKYCNSLDCYPQKAYKRRKALEKKQKKSSQTNKV